MNEKITYGCRCLAFACDVSLWLWCSSFLGSWGLLGCGSFGFRCGLFWCRGVIGSGLLRTAGRFGGSGLLFRNSVSAKMVKGQG